MLSIIVAQAKNGVIGKVNDLPWHLPDDLARFKQLTTGHTVIMGRKTLESIMTRIHKPLPNRRNIVLTRNSRYEPEGVEVAVSVEEVLDMINQEQEAFVIGGSQVYQAFLPHTDRIYLTQVEADIDGDSYFPALGPEWREVSRENHSKDERHPYSFSFVTLEKR